MLIFTRDIKTKELFKGRLRRAAADVKDFLLFEHIRLTGIIKGEPGRKIFESNGEFKVVQSKMARQFYALKVTTNAENYETEILKTFKE